MGERLRISRLERCVWGYDEEIDATVVLKQMLIWTLCDTSCHVLVFYIQVLRYVHRIASYLQREVGLRPGDRCVLLYPPGMEVILAFMGCIASGCIPVPVYPPVSINRLCSVGRQ